VGELAHDCFASTAHLRSQVLLLMVLAMAVILYRNRQRAKEFFIKFIQVEGLLAVEVPPFPTDHPSFPPLPG
jgi:hypothetical protein